MKATIAIVSALFLAGCGASETQLARASLDAGVAPYGAPPDPALEDGPGNDPLRMERRMPGLIDDDLDLSDGVVH